MKVWLILALYVGLAVCTSILEQLLAADTLFALEGPSSNTLQSYDKVLQHKDIDDRIRSQVHFKKALIEINLNKPNQAIQDLNAVLKLDPNHKTAKSKLSQLYIERGIYDDILSTEAKNEITKVNKIIENAQKLFSSQDFVECIHELDTALETSPLSVDAISLHFNSSLNLYKVKPETKINDYPINKVLIQDIEKLISIKPFNLDNYQLMIDLSLFTECDYIKSKKYVQSCLRIDNEYIPCREMAKFQNRFSNFLEILEDYSIELGHYTISTEVASTIEVKNFDFKQINQFLFNDPLKVNKIEKNHLPTDIKTNYDYLLFKSKEYKGKFIDDITKLACESYIQIKDYTRGQKICNSINDQFLPKEIPHIDKLLLKKKFEEVRSILDKYNKNVQQTELFQERFAKVDEFYREQERQQQQHHYQQQQQQQQHYRQQQQQQQFQRPTSKPKNDYYKVLDVPRDADEKTIKKGYRSQTLKYHPDKCLGNKLTPEQCESKMQDINRAYEVLSNKELRARFDRGDDPNDNSQSQPQQHNPFGQQGQQFQFNFNNGNPFGQQFFGGQGFKFSGGNFGGFGQGTKAKVKKNRRRKP